MRGRAASSGSYPSRPWATGELGDLLAAGGRLHAALAAWVGELDGLAEVADALVAGGAQLRASMDASQAAAAEFSAVVSAHDGFSPILGSITLWADMVTEIHALLAGLAERLDVLRTSVAQTRFRIALSALQSETVGQFACELIDQVPGSEDARPAVHLLVQALREGVEDAAIAMEENAALAGQVADEVQALAELIGVPTSLLGSFEMMAASRPNAAVDALLPRVAEVVSASQADADALLVLAGRCRGVRPLETVPVLGELAMIDRLVMPAAA